MKVKVCGITNFEDALLCEACGADAVGFIFYNKSKRYIKPETTREIIKSLSPFTMKVGVFVDENVENINRIASEIKLNAIQLSGNESPENSSKIILPVIKGFRIKEDFDFSIIDRYKNTAYLLDAFSSEEFGGTGKKFTWDLIPAYLKNKIILAGGVSVDNIENIFRKIQPAAVDLSSSLEKAPGIKDKEKVVNFFEKFNLLRLKETSC